MKVLSEHFIMTNGLTLSLPISIMMGKRKPKPWYINLNNYRNAPFHLLSDVKIRFKELVQGQVEPLPVFKKVWFDYTVFAGSNRELDTNNIATIVDKFFSDAFVELGKLPDDNYKYLIKTSFGFGGVDKTNPRCDVLIFGEI